MPNQVVKMKRDVVVPCLTCPLCHKFFRDATTIMECLHTFCKKCIYKKLSDEEMEHCPVCNVNLGCSPVEKLRPDNNLQDVRSKIFPYKRGKVEAPEVVTPVTLPAKRKERSLSSLVVNTPRVSPNSGMRGRRSKSIARKASRGSSFTVEKPFKKAGHLVIDLSDSSSSPETLNNFSQNSILNSNAAGPSGHPSPDKGREIGSEPLERIAEPWKPLNSMIEATARSKSSTLISQTSVGKPEVLHSHDDGLPRKMKNKEHGQKMKVQDEKKGSDNAPQESEQPKKLHGIRQKKTQNFGEFRVPPQAVPNPSSDMWERRKNPIRFSLIACDNQKEVMPLPQVSASYLRVKDGNRPVSFIQKYLKGKLDLTSENEVEIRCMGQAVVPTMKLDTLVDLWRQTTTSERVSATVGSSAKEFMMVLGYARKIPAP